MKRLVLKYGTEFNWVRLVCPTNSITPDQWVQITVTYSGQETGVSSDQMNNYYSRFKVYLDGQLQTTTNSHQNYGYNGSVDFTSVQFGNDLGKIASVAIWNTVRNTGGVQNHYNNAIQIDYMTLSIKPKYYWFFRDGVLEQDGIQLTNSFTETLVNDAPPSN